MVFLKNYKSMKTHSRQKLHGMVQLEFPTVLKFLLFLPANWQDECAVLNFKIGGSLADPTHKKE